VKTRETLTVVTREEWRSWLAEHHQGKTEIWLVFFRKQTGKPTIAYNDAVEVAICFGWIDSQQRRLDEERYAIRFTPRRPRSHWSESNKERAARLLRSGEMTPAGMATLPDDLLAPSGA
jgi:uncharacterized protein YdeI (YjbR/CyaY-like superfamily)